MAYKLKNMMYVASLTGEEIRGLKKLSKNHPVNFCPMYKDDLVVESVLKYFNTVYFDSLGFLINKGAWCNKKIRKNVRFSFINHIIKYIIKLLKFYPKEVNMFDYHKNMFLTIFLSFPIYIVCLIRKIPFNIVVWNLQTYELFKKIFFLYHGVSIASGWEDSFFIKKITNEQKYIHCFGLDGKQTALKYKLRYDTFEWIS